MSTESLQYVEYSYLAHSWDSLGSNPNPDLVRETVDFDCQRSDQAFPRWDSYDRRDRDPDGGPNLSCDHDHQDGGCPCRENQRVRYKHRRRIKTEEKAKVVASVWGKRNLFNSLPRFSCFAYRTILNNRMNCTRMI